MRTIGKIAVMVVLLILTVPVAVCLFAGRDIPEPDVSDLKVDRPDIPAEQNGFPLFLQTTNTLYWPTNSTLITDFIAGKPIDEIALQAALYRNADMMAVVREGVARARCVAPEVTDIDVSIPYVGDWVKNGKVLAAQTRQDRLAGRYGESTDRCLDLLRFGNRVQADAGTIIQYIVGSAVEMRAVVQAQDLARDPETPKTDLERLADELSALTSCQTGLVRALKGEFKVVVNTIDQSRDGRFNTGTKKQKFLDIVLSKRWLPGYVFQPNRTKQICADWYREAISNAPLPYAEMSLPDAQNEYTHEDRSWTFFVAPNVFGRVLLTIMNPSLDILLERTCRTECNRSATRILVAVELYRRETGARPADLDALTPRYLPAVPRDPYDGRPFRYLPAKGIIYSVGKDAKDSGGSLRIGNPKQDMPKHKQRWDREDVVFELGAPAEVGR